MEVRNKLEEIIIENRQQNLVYNAIKIGLIIAILTIFIFILYKLSKAVVQGVKEQKSGKIAICMTISLILFWPIAIGQGIYILLEWNNGTKKNQRSESNQKQNTFLNQADYEKWKAERQKQEP